MERYPKLQHKMGRYPPILDPFVDNFRTHNCILFKFNQPLSQKINFKILSDKRGNICWAFPSHAQWEQVKHVKISDQRNSQRPTLPPGQSLSLLLKFSLYGDSWMMVDDVNIGRHLGSQRKWQSKRALVTVTDPLSQVSPIITSFQICLTVLTIWRGGREN